MIRTCLIIAVILVPSVGAAEIYRWVDDAGRVHFSDRWNQGSEKVATPAKPDSDAPASSLPQPDSPDVEFLGPYSALDIIAPAANETLTQQDAGLPVSLMVNPPLMEGHQMAILLDEAPLTVAKGATQFRLTGTALGSHRLQVRITGDDGSVVAQSTPRQFHVQRPEEPGQLR